MKVFEKFKGLYYRSNLGAICPECYNQFPFGDIKIKVKICFDPTFPQEALRVRGAYAINQESGSQDESTLIRVRCPFCKENMIIVDENIRELVTAFNEQCFFTKWSCAGHYPSKNSSGSVIPYISFFDANLIKGFNEFLINYFPSLAIEDDGEANEGENAQIFVYNNLSQDMNSYNKLFNCYPGIENLRFVYQDNGVVDMELISTKELEKISFRRIRDKFNEAAGSYLKLIIDQMDNFLGFTFPDDSDTAYAKQAAAIMSNYRHNPNNHFTLKNRIDQDIYDDDSYIESDDNFDIDEREVIDSGEFENQSDG